MSSLINSVVTIDGVTYGVVQGTFVRRWTRSFTSNLAANIVRLNFVDRGPGIRVYDFQVMAYNWATTSLPYKQGATANFDSQRQTIEASYSKIATPLAFLDPFGEPPTFSGALTSNISSGTTTIPINNGLATLLSSPPPTNANPNGAYPYNIYVWPAGQSFGAALAAGITGTSNVLEQMSVTNISGNNLTVVRGSPASSWSSGANVATYCGVFFTNLNQTETNDMSSANPRVLYDVELTESTQLVN